LTKVRLWTGVPLDRRSLALTCVSRHAYIECGGRNFLRLAAYPLHRRIRSTARESLRNVFDISYIILLVVAVLIFLRLRSVLGQRTGRERPPYDPYSVRRPATDNVVTLPGRAAETPASVETPRAPDSADTTSDKWKGIAQPGTALAAALDAIVAADRSFDAKHFVAGARTAYEMIVTAYAEGDRRTLKNLLSRDVYDGFEAVINQREGRGESAETRFVSIDTTEITGAELRARTAQVTVRFMSHIVTVVRDRSGNVIDGNPDKVTDVTDVWTFSRDLSVRDPNWKLVATEAGH